MLLSQSRVECGTIVALGLYSTRPWDSTVPDLGRRGHRPQQCAADGASVLARRG